MSCKNCNRDSSNSHLRQKFQEMESELINRAHQIIKTAGDPFSGVVSFLHERPDGTPLHGYLVERALEETFGGRDEIPGLIKALASHVKEVIRQANVIRIVNEHPTSERWGDYIIKQKESMNFEIAYEKGLLVLKNIKGLVGIEGGIELPLDKITVKPPKLIVTVNLGILRPQRILDI